MMVIQIYAAFLILLGSYQDYRSRHDDLIKHNAEIYNDCKDIYYYNSKKTCADIVFKKTKDIIGCVELLKERSFIDTTSRERDWFDCGGVTFHVSRLDDIDDIEKYYKEQINNIKIESEKLAEEDLFDVYKNSIGRAMLTERIEELGCEGEHVVKKDIHTFWRPCKNSCIYKLYASKDLVFNSELIKKNENKKIQCDNIISEIENKIDINNKERISNRYPTNKSVYFSQLYEQFYNYKLDLCMYVVKKGNVNLDDDLKKGVIDYSKLNFDTDSYYGHDAEEHENTRCYLAESKNELENILKDYRP